MSTAEPFMPAHEPAAEPDPREHDIDGDVDVIIEQASGGDAIEVHENAPRPPFRTPVAGDRLTDDELDDDLREPS